MWRRSRTAAVCLTHTFAPSGEGGRRTCESLTDEGKLFYLLLIGKVLAEDIVGVDVQDFTEICKGIERRHLLSEHITGNLLMAYA